MKWKCSALFMHEIENKKCIVFEKCKIQIKLSSVVLCKKRTSIKQHNVLHLRRYFPLMNAMQICVPNN